ncbi:MAG: glutamate-5-semialdehyde dehydrogenase [Dehalococcoidia bacterium]|nr:glutamate-5-semialdehyde dehydrogenase [Chloroflexi bacterium CFX7]MCL4232610.1 glutamate-5-semialdehyde dehydrogenase [Dehalococcoidia bacterium]NUQ55575.1 glutamate-5-semialdehyde dehydrogenase [Dehalococcoidia bacterium]RIL02829.1 MAG: glutamate-5-semialdehyde dehydrogenase [bacterium]
MTTATSYIRERAAAARAAAKRLATLSTGAKNSALLRIAGLLETSPGPVLEANARDLDAGRQAGLDDYFLERLTLTPERLRGIAADTRTVASLPDPVGEVFDSRTLPNGLLIGRRRVPLGVVACIYEARPNVTVDIAALALKSGNASLLRGGKEARHSNAALGEVIQQALAGTEVPPDAVQVVSDPDRGHVDELLKSHDLVDLMVPRGGAQLIGYVRQNATMPVVAHGDAVVQIYVDAEADLDMAVNVADNAKTRRYSICNAVDTLLVHAVVAPAFLGRMCERWGGKVTLIADDRALALLAPERFPGIAVERATEATWKTEHLALRVGVRIVDSLEEAIAHIEEHGSHHSDAILTSNYANAMRFADEVDSAAVYVNASTQFTDGAQFGLGAEVGISTQKMHARGPMGLRELTSYKWTIFGKGQVRPL